MSKGVGWWNHAQTMLIHSELFQIFLPIIQVFIQKDINHISMTTILKLDILGRYIGMYKWIELGKKLFQNQYYGSKNAKGLCSKTILINGKIIIL